jgi:hypothetical protein
MMEKNMKNIVNLLRRLYWLGLGSVVVLWILIETVLMDAVGGVLADNDMLEFYCQMFLVLLTLATSYLALRLFKFSAVERQLKERPLERYLPLSNLRLSMIWMPLVLNLLAYLLFLNASFSWLAAMGLLLFAFVYPSEGRFLNETGQEEV